MLTEITISEDYYIGMGLVALAICAVSSSCLVAVLTSIAQGVELCMCGLPIYDAWMCHLICRYLDDKDSFVLLR